MKKLVLLCLVVALAFVAVMLTAMAPLSTALAYRSGSPVPTFGPITNVSTSPSAPLQPPTPHPNDVHVCYLFDPRYDDDLVPDVFNPPAWVDRWITEESLSSYQKNRLGLYVMGDADKCPRVALFFMRAMKEAR